MSAETRTQTPPKVALAAPKYAAGFAILHWVVALLLVTSFMTTEARTPLTGTSREVVQGAHIQLGLLFLDMSRAIKEIAKVI